VVTVRAEILEDAEQENAWLRGRVAALEAALERRSHELRLLQRMLCPRDFAQWARLAAGLPPLPRIACEPGCWQETAALTAAEVPETLAALWASLYPPAPPAPPGPPGHSEPPEPLRPAALPRPARKPSR
jgi:hypothetical protein